MLNQKQVVAELLLRLRTIGLTDHRLLSAIELTPRQKFVPGLFSDIAYCRGPLPIDCGQTMNGADEVARVVNALDIRKNSKVLELGTGSGYQSALISRLASDVKTIERYKILVNQAQSCFADISINNVDIIHADALEWSPEENCYDRIISNCSFTETPTKFIKKLNNFGIMLAPVGPPDDKQNLVQYIKTESCIQKNILFSVRFLPFLKGISQIL